MEYNLTIKASFNDEKHCEKVAKLFNDLKKRVKEVDEAIKKDTSNTDTCFQTYSAQANDLAAEFIEDVSTLLNKPWQAGKDIDPYVVKEIIRGLDMLKADEKDVHLEIMVSGYARESIKFLLPLMSDLGATSVSAKGTNDEDFKNTDGYEFKNGEIHYWSTKENE